MQSLYITIALLGGIVLPLQVGLNSTVAQFTGSPIWASVMSFLVGTVGLCIYFIATRQPMPALSAMGSVPPYAWAAGLLGAFYVTISIIVAPKIGAAMLVSLAIAGQMAAAMVLDHYGAFGFPQQAVNWGRVAGALMVVAGVVMIRKF